MTGLLPVSLLLSVQGRVEAQDLSALERRCDRGEAQQCDIVARHYANGRGLPKDERRAAELFRKACKAGWVAACLPGCVGGH